jgi:hypothetical protein
MFLGGTILAGCLVGCAAGLYYRDHIAQIDWKKTWKQGQVYLKQDHWKKQYQRWKKSASEYIKYIKKKAGIE